jgi:hypothetical protein
MARTASALMAIIFAASLGGVAHAETPADAILRTMQKIERDLCKRYPSRKCAKAATRKVKSQRSTRKVTRAAVEPPAVAAAPSSIIPKPVPRPEVITERVAAREELQVKPIVAPPKPPVPPVKIVAPAPPKPEVKVAAASPPAAPLPAPTPPAMPEDGSACLQALAQLGVSFAPVPQPAAALACQVQNPVRLNSVKASGTVKFPDQPVLACGFALHFAGWVQGTADPEVARGMSSPLASVSTGPGFDCRGRNGDSSAKMSEHAVGNAVDIERMKLADGTVVVVKDGLNPQSRGFALLTALRASACADFATVLGPGTNSAHADHLHLDQAQRKKMGRSGICQ